MHRAARIAGLLLVAAVLSVRPALGGELFIVTRANAMTPHIACVLRYDDGRVQWLHFRPVPFKKSILGWRVAGQLDEIDFDENINHIVAFDVCDHKLWRAERRVRQKFAANSQYHLTDRNCITFAIAICEECGIRTKANHLTPYSMFSYVRRNNDPKELVWNVDRLSPEEFTLPWHRPLEIGDGWYYLSDRD